MHVGEFGDVHINRESEILTVIFLAAGYVVKIPVVGKERYVFQRIFSRGEPMRRVAG